MQLMNMKKICTVNYATEPFLSISFKCNNPWNTFKSAVNFQETLHNSLIGN